MLALLSELMNEGKTNPEERVRLGLCADCGHARRIESAKGSQFLLCALSQTDPSFPKYPRLPVLRCAGYTPVESKA